MMVAPWQECGEFLTTQPDKKRVGSRFFAGGLCEQLENLISDWMAVTVVDRLEVVEVEGKQGDGVALPLPDDPSCLLKKGVAVRKPGQLIGLRQAEQVLLLLLSNDHQKGHRHRYRIQDGLVHRRLSDGGENIWPVLLEEDRGDERAAEVPCGKTQLCCTPQ
ncbi:hypothetical protein J3A65_004514 [Rhizobium sp. PvP014]|nr:hypothetical protein [Rhizobium sp. PvP014]MBP2532208.1 hypothetical protein [Rhizobium sp. PvP099]